MIFSCQQFSRSSIPSINSLSPGPCSLLPFHSSLISLQPVSCNMHGMHVAANNMHVAANNMHVAANNMHVTNMRNINDPNVHATCNGPLMHACDGMTRAMA